MRRRLKVTDAAQRELLEIWSFIARDNENAADKILITIAKQFDKLLKFPELGRERNELLPHLRSVAVIFYQLTDKYVEIVRLLHGARDLKRIFVEA